MHCVNVNENSSNERRSEGDRVLTAGELLGRCRLVEWAQVEEITWKRGMAGLTGRTGRAKSLPTRIRWGTVRVCGLACFSGIRICRYWRPS